MIGGTISRGSPDLGRRRLMTSALALAGLTLAGCGQTSTRQEDGSNDKAQVTPTARARTASMTVYRDPSCGCCEAWAAIARKAGHEVQLVDHPDMAGLKRQYGVPAQLTSCHTTLVGDYVVEGHVPLEDVARLLRDKPANVRGIAVAGMPLGSPGMEIPDGTKQPFEVMAFDAAGQVRRFG